MFATRSTTVALTLAAWLAAVTTPTAAAELRLLGQCSSSSSMITLGDIAVITAADDAQAGQLGRIELFPAPVAGTQRYLRLREIQDLLLLRGVNLVEHQFTGSNQVLIVGGQAVREQVDTALTAAVVRKANARVHEAVVDYLQRNAPSGTPWIVEMELSPAQARAVADYSGTIVVAGGAAPWAGAQRFEFSLEQAERPTRFEVEAQVGVPPTVVVVVRPLTRGAIVRETDVDVQQSQVAESDADVFTRLDEVVGRETTRALTAGRVLTRDAVREPLSVRRGDVVTVYARSPGIQIRTTGRVKDDGSVGELVAVESFHNRGAFFARVCGVREVEVYAHAPQIEATPAAAPRHSAPAAPATAATKIRLSSETNPAMEGAIHATHTR
jgi:flagella basal body P-ring formation protein FlgA